MEEVNEIKILKNKRIGLITGGLSPERDIALRSGRAVEKAFKKIGLKFVKIDFSRNNRRDIFTLIRKSKIDLVFLALHGCYGEDGKIQGALEIMGIPCIGSDTLSSAVAMDKIITKKIFVQGGIPTPQYQVFNKGDLFKRSMTNCELQIKREPFLEMDLPVVVKPNDCGSTIGVNIVSKLKNLKKAMSLAFKYSEKVLIEKYIKGKEITVPIFDNKALPVIEIISKTKFYDYKAKYVKGFSRHILPANIKSSIYKKAQDLAWQAHKILGLKDFSRVDMILGDHNKIYVLEVNSLPGLTKTSLLPEALRFIGISFEKMVLEMLINALKR
ncbi:MAG: D-alanine--D-alanine ligase [Candidatus Firestonebacteria bacterium]